MLKHRHKELARSAENYPPFADREALATQSALEITDQLEYSARSRDVLASEDIQLENLMDGLAESVIDASGSDVFEEAQEDGDPVAQAEEVRVLLLRRVEEARRTSNIVSLHPPVLTRQ